MTISPAFNAHIRSQITFGIMIAEATNERETHLNDLWLAQEHKGKY